MALIRITDSIKFAKEIAEDVTSKGLPSEEDIRSAVKIMNERLHGMGQDRRVLLRAAKVFTIPTDEFEADFLSEPEIQQSIVEDAFVKARLRSFIWLGSVSISGFGVNLYGVDFIEPRHHHTESAFMPLDAAGPRINVQYRH